MATVNITSSNISQYFTVSNSTYYFAGNGDTFTSNNNGLNRSSATTELTALYDFTTVSFNYSYSSEERYDKLTIKVGSTTVANALSGVGSSSWSGAVSKGTVISFTYSKDGSGHRNDDKCTFSNMVVEGNSVGSRNIYIGVDNKARHVKKLYIGVNGVARKIKKAYIGVNGKARLFYKYELATTQWVFTSNGTFTVPETGTYTIELHGGGGGGGGGYESLRGEESSGGDGGSSGKTWTNIKLLSGNSYSIIIGAGGSGGSGGKYSRDDTAGYTGSSGGATSFGSLYTISGGGGGTGGRHTNSDGSINGKDGTSYGSPVEYNNYWYGNGGYGGSGYSSGSSGSSGIAIITLTDY